MLTRQQRHLAGLARSFDVGSTNHRGIAYAALAANDAIEESAT